jgi:hypothetical protein
MLHELLKGTSQEHRNSISYCHSPRIEASVGFELPPLDSVCLLPQALGVRCQCLFVNACAKTDTTCARTNTNNRHNTNNKMPPLRDRIGALGSIFTRFIKPTQVLPGEDHSHRSNIVIRSWIQWECTLWQVCSETLASL